MNNLSFKTFKKKEIILKEGQTCNYLYFVDNGILRGYSIRENGKEATNWFKIKNDFMTSSSSFFLRKPSKEMIEALEDCDLYYIHHYDLKQLYDKHPEFNTIVRKIICDCFELDEEIRKVVVYGTAKEKYDFAINNCKKLMNLVPHKYIASYVDISPETFSRIRNSNY